MEKNKKNFMVTYTGNKFYPEEPEKTTFTIRDIAHGLSNLCRFGGHTRRFYSVAQHSILVSNIVRSLPGATPDLELWGLMHDATEAYMIDLPTPLKATFPQYGVREDALMRSIVRAFELPPHGEASLLPAVVKEADAIALVTEARQLMYGGVSEWTEPFQAIKPFPTVIAALAPEEVEAAFLARFYEIQLRRSQAKR